MSEPASQASQGEFKSGAGTASCPHFVDRRQFCGDEPSPPPSPPLIAHFLERALEERRWKDTSFSDEVTRSKTGPPPWSGCALGYGLCKRKERVG